MFVHGRECYRRIGFLIIYTFYKNILYIVCQYIFGFYSGFSSQVLYEPFIYQMYNITFTSVPIMYYALFDFEFEKKEFLSNVKHYQIGLKYTEFSYGLLTKWLIYGVVQAFVVFFLCFFFICNPGMQSDGK